MSYLMFRLHSSEPHLFCQGAEQFRVTIIFSPLTFKAIHRQVGFNALPRWTTEPHLVKNGNEPNYKKDRYLEVNNNPRGGKCVTNVSSAMIRISSR